MRRHDVRLMVITGAMTLIVCPPAAAQQPDAKASEIIAAARRALGGEQTLASVKALSMRASYRRELAGPGGGAGGAQMTFMIGPGGAGGQISGEVEIDVVFPDKFIKVDTQAGIAAITRTEGFDGERPLFAVQSNSAHVRIMADNPAADPGRATIALDRARGELARLLLGMVAGTQPGFPVTYSYVGPAESPDGKAEAIDVKGPGGFAVRLFIDAETHLPLMLTYMAPEPRIMTRMAGPGAPPPGGPGARPGGASLRTPADLSPEERERVEKERQALEAQPPKMSEHRLFFADYREVGGISLPHRIVRGTGAATTEEWEVKSYKVNPSIKADRFTVS